MAKEINETVVGQIIGIGRVIIGFILLGLFGDQKKK
jgi:hypothetical protein